MSNEATYGIRLTADARDFNAQVKAAREEMERLGTAAKPAGDAVKAMGAASSANDARAFAAAQKESADAVEKAARAFQIGAANAQQFKKEQEGLTTGGVALAATFAGLATQAAMQFASSLLRSGQAAIETGAEIARLSEKTGVAAATLSTLKYAADLSDTSIGSVASGLDRLSRNAVEASKGTGEARQAFRVLGIDVRDANGGIKDQDRLLFEVADRLAGVDDAATKTSLAMMIFGRAGADLIPFLNNGADGLRRLQTEGSKWAEISGMTAAEAKKLKDNQVELDYASQALGKTIAATLVPYLNSVIRAFIDGKREGDGFLGTLKGIGAAVGTALIGGSDVSIAASNLKAAQAKKADSEKEIARLEGMYGTNSNFSLLRDRRRDLMAANAQIAQSQAVLQVNDSAFFKGTAPKDKGDVAASLAYNQLLDRYKPKEARLADELLQLSNAATGAGTLGSAEYNNAVNEIVRRFGDKPATERAGRSAPVDPAIATLMGLRRQNARLEEDLGSLEMGGGRAAGTAGAALESDLADGKYKISSPERVAAMRAEAAAQDELRDRVTMTTEAWKYYAQGERDAAQASARNVAQTQQWREQLQTATERARIAAEPDERRRATMTFEIEKRTWQQRIAQADEASGAKKLIETDYAEWVIAENDRIEQTLKPGWQRMIEGWQDANRQMRESFDRTMDATVRAGESAAVRWDGTFRGLGDAVGSVLDTIRQEIFRTFYRENLAPLVSGFTKGAMNLFNGSGGGGASWTSGYDLQSARGNVFDNGSVTPFALGGVFDRPMTFRFASGGTFKKGLMAEAGPEAIMPLARGADGKLGIAASGGGAGKVEIHVHPAPNTTTEVRETQRPDGSVLIEMIQGVINQDLRDNGPITQRLGATFGTRRVAMT